MDRGRLRVYLGAAPGVGKTFAMLNEGRRRRDRGTDVVIGLVETHGRERTDAEIGDLEVVPRKLISYRGIEASELDLAGVLRRAPGVALIDELAHTNIEDPDDPSGHEKRWQDIETLLDHGIDVITTLNVQHLESLNDVVESITGVRQQETVPDAIVRAADAVELVDMSPQALRRRMAHGNIYPAEKIDTALSRYFREGNLAALRELALLWLADRVDEGLERYREAHGIESTWTTRERIVVAISGGEESTALMRRAARIASRTAGAEWMAVYVSRSDGLKGVSAEQLERLRRKTTEMSGTFHAVVSADTAGGLLAFARGVNASQILVGASRRSRLATALQPGIGEMVIAESGDIDVHVVSHDYARGRSLLHRRRTNLGRRRVITGYLMATIGSVLLTTALYVTPSLHGLPTESMLMMALVVATALVGGLWPAVVGSLISGVALNLFFVPPTMTLTIADPENALALLVFLITGIAVASVVDLAGRRTEEATRARSEANALAVLSHRLLHTGGDQDQLLLQACEVFGMNGASLIRHDGATDADRIVARCGQGPETLDRADVSIRIDDEVELAMAGRTLEASDRPLLTAYAAHFAVIRERQRAAADSRQRAQLVEGNRTRTALLAAVSHDLRSPLAAIKASISSLRGGTIVWSPEDEAELLATIEESADRLDALVGNLLDMSRLQMGTVTPLLAEIDLGAAVDQAIRPIAGSDRVKALISDDLPLALADAGLLDRVLANIIENALRYTPAEVAIDVTAAPFHDESGRDWVSLRVVDHGPGVPGEGKETLFAPFQRLGDVPRGDGIGLGLAVARGLTEVMHGELSAEDTPGGGLTMVVDLPAAEAARVEVARAEVARAGTEES
ncbi:DUF4118 domain-containing protein [Microlunatus speluncae]|uniref:DUF4118 domain-containing protein n=1 Tax=Microlunatus speluncae TaxID=2594267 RepID=UPI0012662064|nr:DUF4118 domain-containing protein [Microlunatus speluncae]